MVRLHTGSLPELGARELFPKEVGLRIQFQSEEKFATGRGSQGKEYKATQAEATRSAEVLGAFVTKFQCGFESPFKGPLNSPLLLFKQREFTVCSVLYTHLFLAPMPPPLPSLPSVLCPH